MNVSQYREPFFHICACAIVAVVAILAQLAFAGIGYAQSVAPHTTAKDDIPPGQGLASKPIYYHDHYRFSFGGGSSLALSTDAPTAFLGTAAWQHDNQLLSVGFVESGSNNRTQPQHTWAEGDLLYGYAIDGYDLGLFGYQPERIFASVSAGLSFFDYATQYHRPRGFIQPITYPPNSAISGIGIPIQIQAFYAPVTFLGIGVTAFANLNTQQINYGGVVSLQYILTKLPFPF